MEDKHKNKQTGIKSLIFANLGLICLVSCSTTFQPRPKTHSLQSAAVVPANPGWLWALTKKVENFHSADLFPKGMIDFKPPVAAKSKYEKVLGGRLAGHGKDFEDAAKKYGIPVELLCAISIHETGHGTSKLLKERNNAFGSMVRIGGVWTGRKFKSIRESAFFTAASLKNNYFDKGLDTVQEIQRKYAPIIKNKKSKDYNDPFQKNGNWAGNVTRLKKEIYNL